MGHAASPEELLDQDEACVVVKKHVAIEASLPETGPPGMGWFCDFSGFRDSRDERWFLIALRSNRPCDGICSNLMGWYAVERTTGSLHDFDMGENEIGREINKE